jgi:hypothetical protein
MLTASEYLMEIQVPRIREKAMQKTIRTLRNLLHPDCANISDERLRAWPSEAEPAEIVAALDLDGREAEAARAAFHAIRLLSKPAEDLNEAVELVVASYLAAPNPPKRENVVRQVTEALKSPYSQPPGDALFVSAIAPEHDMGYFVYLRHLEQVWEPEIATRPTRSAITYRRISRLKERYVHALIQRFALVFMSIGLPKEYEEIRDLHAELLGESVK